MAVANGSKHKTGPEAIKALSLLGLPVKFADHHWKIELDGAGRVDWFPVHGQWQRYPGGTMQGGTFYDFLTFLDKAKTEADGDKGAAVQRHVSEKFQDQVVPWMLTTFNEEVCRDKLERADRFIEEALELAQTMPGFGAERAHALVDYVFGRPVGEAPQEVGGVMVTLAALCMANHMDMHHEGDRELKRVWTKVEQIRAKQAAKPHGSALPIATIGAAQ